MPRSATARDGFGDELFHASAIPEPPGNCVCNKSTLPEVLVLASKSRRSETIDELAADIDPALRLRYGRARSGAEVDRTPTALEKNGFVVLRAATTAEAMQVVLSLIRDGAEVYHGASQTLQLTGITEAIERPRRYRPIRPRIWGMDRQTRADEIPRLAAAPDVMLGSVHAVTETGSLIAASTPAASRWSWSARSSGSEAEGIRQ